MTIITRGVDRRSLLSGTAALLALSACNTEPKAPMATTKHGPVEGAAEDGIMVFKGVRYGATTAGRRFLPPQPPTPWTEHEHTMEYANSSPQNAAGDGGGLYKSWQNPRPQSEDCLFLNVWTPALTGKRPVMVWFHGGGYATGSGSSKAYDGVRLAKRGDVVVVTVNHRLNAFGYTQLPDDAGSEFKNSGNVGNLDMIQSLEWVRDNVAAFGGDPGNVLIMGESGGGGKVSTLLAMPKAQGLFHRAVVQSGSTLTVRTKETAVGHTKALMEAAGAKTAAELQALPHEKLLEALASSGVPTTPVMDGDVLPTQPFTPGAPEVSKSVPMLIGTTKDEQAILSGARDLSLFDLTWETLPGKLGELIRPRGLDPAKVIAQTRALYPDATPGEVYFVVSTEIGMRRNAIKQAERKAAQGGAPAFMYLLTWETPVDGGKWGSPHALDIALMFDNVAKSQTFIGTGAADAQKVADKMAEAWIAFAKTGNPGWAPYDAVNRTTMVFDVESKAVNDPRKEERALYADIKDAPPALPTPARPVAA